MGGRGKYIWWARRQPWADLLPDVYTFNLKVKSRVRDGTARMLTSVLLPHEVFSSLHAYKELFEFLFTGPAGHLHSNHMPRALKECNLYSIAGAVYREGMHVCVSGT